jgi:hypothetical protein
MLVWRSVVCDAPTNPGSPPPLLPLPGPPELAHLGVRMPRGPGIDGRALDLCATRGSATRSEVS